MIQHLKVLPNGKRKGKFLFFLVMGSYSCHDSWLHIADERNPPPWGRIPYPEDIIGTVLVNNGVIQPETYQEMPTHRLVTSNGIFQLSEPLRQCIVDASRKLVKQ